jgi:hypothetical protein
MQNLMNEIGHACEDRPDIDGVAIVHDHGPWDNAALIGYNQMIDDPNWKFRKQFFGITPLSWKQDVGLQSADLFAYESMRYLDDHKWEGDIMRKALRELINRNPKLYSFLLGRDRLQNFRAEVEKRGFTIQEV